MLRVLGRLFAVIGFLTVLSLAGLGTLVWNLVYSEPVLPERLVLELDLTGGLVERASGGSVGNALFRHDTSLREVIDSLDRARGDARVKGVVARLGEVIGLAQAEEIRQAIERLRASGKFALAFADSFGDFGPGNGAYYLAAGFDQVWLQPVGLVGLTGLSSEVPFGREALSLLGVKPELERRAEYKSAVESLTERGFTPAHKEMLSSLLGDLSGQLVAGIASGRQLPPETVKALIDRGPLVAREALEAKLVDQIGGYDAVLEEADRRAGGNDPDHLESDQYLAAAGGPHERGPTVALIYAVGAIQRGGGDGSPVVGEPAAGADDVVAALQDAADDDDVKVIVLRIDSPGGSAVASETIRHALVAAQKAGKKVVVSMGGMAASGGYWIAMNADRIVALPATLTGSIGVFGGKVATDGLWTRLGVAWDRVDQGRNAGIWSSVSPYDGPGRERLNAMLDDIYDSFTRGVAAGRHLPLERVQEIARGRVWTGAQARELGLVDDLGDFEVALKHARELAGLPADAALTVTVYPEPKGVLEKLADLADSLSQAREGAHLLASLRPLLTQLQPLTSAPGDRTLTMPPVGQGLR